MCHQDLKIHFCSCKSKAESSDRQRTDIDPPTVDYLQTQFIWTLARYIGEKDSLMMGEIIYPADKLSEELTAEFIRSQLNSKNLFDFEYIPTEGDLLEIMNSYVHKSAKNKTRKDLNGYLSFIFRDGSWEEDFYDIFNNRIRKFQKGILELRRNS